MVANLLLKHIKYRILIAASVASDYYHYTAIGKSGHSILRTTIGFRWQAARVRRIAAIDWCANLRPGNMGSRYIADRGEIAPAAGNRRRANETIHHAIV